MGKMHARASFWVGSIALREVWTHTQGLRHLWGELAETQVPTVCRRQSQTWDRSPILHSSLLPLQVRGGKEEFELRVGRAARGGAPTHRYQEKEITVEGEGQQDGRRRKP